MSTKPFILLFSFFGLIGLAHEFAKVLPNAHFISPNAPFEFEGLTIDGYQWFSLTNYDPKVLFPQIIQANDILDQFIEFELKKLGLGYKDLILIGFSQGSMMSMYSSLRAKEKIGGVLAYSGRLILPTDLGEMIYSKPSICLVHGTHDSVVPHYNMLEAQKLLEKLEVPLEAHSVDGLDHGINNYGIKVGMSFLEKLAWASLLLPH
jgi:phospholipase/carboxylesterase